MIDVQAVKESADLMGFVDRDTQLKRVAATGGGEWAGPCPFCGGDDRFRVQPNRRPWPLWMCRHCTDGKWQDIIEYVRRRDGLGFRDACAAITSGNIPTTQITQPVIANPAYTPTSGDWQSEAWKIARTCYDFLWNPGGDAALDWLHGRGLTDRTIWYFALGWSPGTRFEALYVPRGVVIPCIVAGEVWYLKIALLPGDPVKCYKCQKRARARQPCPYCGTVNKYRGVKGNRTAAIYNAGDLVGAELALFCEGEIDVMTAWQEVSDVLPIVTLGAATNKIDLAAWGAYLLGLRFVLTTYDSDKAGQAGAAYLGDLLGDRAFSCPLPDGVKDINDYYLSGGDLWSWLKCHLHELGLLAELGVLFDAPQGNPDPDYSDLVSEMEQGSDHSSGDSTEV